MKYPSDEIDDASFRRHVERLLTVFDQSPQEDFRWEVADCYYDVSRRPLEGETDQEFQIAMLQYIARSLSTLNVLIIRGFLDK